MQTPNRPGGHSTRRRMPARLSLLLAALCVGTAHASDPDTLCTNGERDGYWAQFQVDELAAACRKGDVVRVVETAVASVCDLDEPAIGGAVVTCLYRGGLRELRKRR